MPLLDVSDILLDIDLADTFMVTRRAVARDSHGRSVVTSTDIPDIGGVVCAASGNDLRRLPDEQTMGRHLSIITQFRLQGPSPGYQADTVTWEGDVFVVQLVDPYTQYGAGFVQAIVGSMDSLDQPPPA